jgi:hypothetical protein
MGFFMSNSPELPPQEATRNNTPEAPSVSRNGEICASANEAGARAGAPPRIGVAPPPQEQARDDRPTPFCGALASTARPNSQQNRLLLINLALMHEHEAFIGGNKVAHHVAIRAIVRRHHDAHAAGAVDRPDSAQDHVFRHNRMESLLRQECNDIIFRVIIIFRPDGQLPDKSERKKDCQKQFKCGRKSHVSHPTSSSPVLQQESWRR